MNAAINPLPSRRTFLAAGATALAAVPLRGIAADPAPAAAKEPLYKISLAQWSLHNTLFSGKLDNLDFPRAAKQQFGIEAVEYVNQFFKDKARDEDYIAELAKRAADEGVTNVLIMCDGLGDLGAPDDKARRGRRRGGPSCVCRWGPRRVRRSPAGAAARPPARTPPRTTRPARPAAAPTRPAPSPGPPARGRWRWPARSAAPCRSPA